MAKALPTARQGVYFSGHISHLASLYGIAVEMRILLYLRYVYNNARILYRRIAL